MSDEHSAPKGLFGTLKRDFFTGLFVLIPVGMTVFVVLWLIRTLDGFLGNFFQGLFGFTLPGLGLVVSAALFIVVGRLMSSILVQQLFGLLEEVLIFIPGVRGVYKTMKALTDLFSPGAQKSFRNVVLVEYPHAGSLSLGFATREMDLEREGLSQEKQVSVYVPTNHLYLGNTVIVPASKVYTTTLTVQEGMQMILSSGAGFPERISFQPKKSL